MHWRKNKTIFFQPETLHSHSCHCLLIHFDGLKLELQFTAPLITLPPSGYFFRFCDLASGVCVCVCILFHDRGPKILQDFLLCQSIRMNPDGLQSVLGVAGHVDEVSASPDFSIIPTCGPLYYISDAETALFVLVSLLISS